MCGCLYRWVLSNVVVVVPGVSDDGGSSSGGGLNFSRVHGFTYVSHYTGPRLSRRLGGCTSGHGPRTQILATFVSTAFSLVVLVSSYTRCADARTCSLHALEATSLPDRLDRNSRCVRSLRCRFTVRQVRVCACFVERMRCIVCCVALVASY